MIHALEKCSKKRRVYYAPFDCNEKHELASTEIQLVIQMRNGTVRGIKKTKRTKRKHGRRVLHDGGGERGGRDDKKGIVARGIAIRRSSR
jgi:hypothetical protein